MDSGPATPFATLLWQLLPHYLHFYDGGKDLETAALQSSSSPGRDMWFDKYSSRTVARNEKLSIISQGGRQMWTCLQFLHEGKKIYLFC